MNTVHKSLVATCGLAAFIVALILGTGYLANLNGRQALLNGIESDVRREMHHAKKRTESAIDKCVSDLVSLASQPVMERILDDDADGDIANLLDIFRENSPVFRDFTCLNANGQVVATTRTSDLQSKVDIPDTIWKRLSENLRYTFIPNKGGIRITVPVHIEFDEREFIGAIQALASETYFISDGTGWWTGLADQSGHVFVERGAISVSNIPSQQRSRIKSGKQNLSLSRAAITFPKNGQVPKWFRATAEPTAVLYAPVFLLKSIYLRLTTASALIVVTVIAGFSIRQKSLLKKLEEQTLELAISDAENHSIVDCAADGIVTICENGIIEKFNGAAESIFGYKAKQAIGQNVKMLVPPPYREKHDGYIRGYLENNMGTILNLRREVLGQRKDGSTFPMDLHVSAIKVADRQLFSGLIRDITERKKNELQLLHAREELIERNDQLEIMATQLADTNAQLAQQARIDPLTRRLNRRAWEESAQLEYERTIRNGQTYSIMMLDVDHFKMFNDTLGHQAGDDCLVTVAACISQACRSIDLVGRYGGEEFIVLLPETHIEEAREIAQRVCNAVSQLNIAHTSSATADHLTISIGISASNDAAVRDTIYQADQALYHAKEEGRNRVCLAQPQPA